MNRAQAFIAAYRRTGNVVKAARAAKIQRQLHYRRLRSHDPEYTRAFKDAQAEAMERLRHEAEKRADKIHALEISKVDARIEALQSRWNQLRQGVEQIIQERGADMADIPGGRSGLLCRDYKGKDATAEVYKIDPGIVGLLGELRAHEKQAAEQLGQWISKNEHTGKNGGAIEHKFFGTFEELLQLYRKTLAEADVADD